MDGHESTPRSPRGRRVEVRDDEPYLVPPVEQLDPPGRRTKVDEKWSAHLADRALVGRAELGGGRRPSESRSGSMLEHAFIVMEGLTAAPAPAASETHPTVRHRSITVVDPCGRCGSGAAPAQLTENVCSRMEDSALGREGDSTP